MERNSTQHLYWSQNNRKMQTPRERESSRARPSKLKRPSVNARKTPPSSSVESVEFHNTLLKPLLAGIGNRATYITSWRVRRSPNRRACGQSDALYSATRYSFRYFYRMVVWTPRGLEEAAIHKLKDLRLVCTVHLNPTKTFFSVPYCDYLLKT